MQGPRRVIAKRRRAFSLIELVIVVVIIAIIAAIAIPRMSRGVRGSGDAAFIADLAVLRSAIDRYASEHGGTLPGTAIVSQLTQFTSDTGAVSPTRDSTYIHGPYLRRIPPLPVGVRKGATGVFTTITGVPPGGTAADGWWYHTGTGEIRANLPNGNVDDRGKAYNTY